MDQESGDGSYPAECKGKITNYCIGLGEVLLGDVLFLILLIVVLVMVVGWIICCYCLVIREMKKNCGRLKGSKSKIKSTDNLEDGLILEDSKRSEVKNSSYGMVETPADGQETNLSPEEAAEVMYDAVIQTPKKPQQTQSEYTNIGANSKLAAAPPPAPPPPPICSSAQQSAGLVYASINKSKKKKATSGGPNIPKITTVPHSYDIVNLDNESKGEYDVLKREPPQSKPYYSSAGDKNAEASLFDIATEEPNDMYDELVTEEKPPKIPFNKDDDLRNNYDYVNL